MPKAACFCLEDDGGPWCAAKCGHTFHSICIQRWFSNKTQSKKTCPWCKVNLSKADDVRQLFLSGDDDDDSPQEAKSPPCTTRPEHQQLWNTLQMQVTRLEDEKQELEAARDIAVADYKHLHSKMATLLTSKEKHKAIANDLRGRVADQGKQLEAERGAHEATRQQLATLKATHAHTEQQLKRVEKLAKLAQAKDRVTRIPPDQLQQLLASILGEEEVSRQDAAGLLEALAGALKECNGRLAGLQQRVAEVEAELAGVQERQRQQVQQERRRHTQELEAVRGQLLDARKKEMELELKLHQQAPAAAAAEDLWAGHHQQQEDATPADAADAPDAIWQDHDLRSTPADNNGTQISSSSLLDDQHHHNASAQAAQDASGPLHEAGTYQEADEEDDYDYGYDDEPAEAGPLQGSSLALRGQPSFRGKAPRPALVDRTNSSFGLGGATMGIMQPLMKKRVGGSLLGAGRPMARMKTSKGQAAGQHSITAFFKTGH